MNAMLAPISDIVFQYNWLVTEAEFICDGEIWRCENDGWIMGKELLNDLAKPNAEFIWGVFSAFELNVYFDEAMKSEPPSIVQYHGYRENPVKIQHPLAQIEILAVDSSFAVFISKNDAIVDLWAANFPGTLDLEKHNNG